MIKVQKTIGDRDLIIETGKFAKQADGAVYVQYGGTVVLVTAVISAEPKEQFPDFLPLTVEYQEKTYAAGRIPGGFFRREGRPSEREILSARLIDRTIRPLFQKGFNNEIQVMAIVLSSDCENAPDVLALIGASAALSISDIPFLGPVGALRVGNIEDKFVLNPTYAQLEKSTFDFVRAGSQEKIIMLEGAFKEVSDAKIYEAVEYSDGIIEEIIELQKELVSKCGKPKKEVELREIDEVLFNKVRKLSLPKLEKMSTLADKEKREEAKGALLKELKETLVCEEDGIGEDEVKAALNEIWKAEVRKIIIKDKKRIDLRAHNEIRAITCEIGVLPRTHGSGLFTRGQTQSLCVTTLGTSEDEQLIDALEGESLKRFMLHYSFPPFSVGEVSPVRGPGRREIGHGALAERALKAVMPSKEAFPYTVRVASEILESNGSTSMATVCAGSLSLMDAGVPIKSGVGGIAMGLVKEGKNFVILTDISGLEDHFGDMDFKITTTKDGVTALQLDVKLKDGLTKEILKAALEQARPACKIVLEKMEGVISKPKESISIYAPRITTLKIPQDKIGGVIGPGGKVIRKIIEETGVTINIEDGGIVSIGSTDESAARRAVEIIKGITEEAKVGNMYLGTVKRLVNFGAFVEIAPGKEGLVHISELSDKFVKNIEDEVKIGDQFLVKVIEVDQMGRINLSRKQALAKEKDEENKDKD